MTEPRGNWSVKKLLRAPLWGHSSLKKSRRALLGWLQYSYPRRKSEPHYDGDNTPEVCASAASKVSTLPLPRKILLLCFTPS